VLEKQQGDAKNDAQPNRMNKIRHSSRSSSIQRTKKIKEEKKTKDKKNKRQKDKEKKP